jgi:hypothetical protein
MHVRWEDTFAPEPPKKQIQVSWMDYPAKTLQAQDTSRLSFDTDPLAGGPGVTPPPATPPPSTPPPLSKTVTPPPGGLSFDQPTAPQEPYLRAPVTPGPRRPAPAPDFAASLTKLQGLTDPAQIAMERDKLARGLFTSLKASGHDVKWNGDQLVVDGRPYVVGGGQMRADSASQGFAPGEPTPGSGTANTQPPAQSPVAAGTLGQYGIPKGAVPDKFNDATYHTPKYDLSRLASQALDPRVGLTPEFVDQVNALYPDDGEARMLSRDKLSWDGDVIDLIIDSDGANPQLWYGSEREYADAHGGGAPLSFLQSEPVGIDAGTNWEGTGMSEAAWRARYPAPGTPGDPGAPPVTPMSGIANGWKPGQGPQYTPGEIPLDDIPTFSYEQMFGDLTRDDPSSAATDRLIQSLLANPESLDERTVETLKARSKEEIAQMQATEDEDLQAFGGEMGIEDSPWLRSERNAARRSRDASLIDSNRDIDLQAAATRAGDRRAAAELGMSWSGARNAQRQSAAQLASNTVLQTAALRGDRLALRESIKQEAAKLGQSADQVMSSWLMGLLEDATQRYGIATDDATKRFGIEVSRDIDMRKLNQQGQEFKEELAFKLAQLAQMDRQFGAGYGLDFARLQFDMDRDAWDRSTGDLSFE